MFTGNILYRIKIYFDISYCWQIKNTNFINNNNELYISDKDYYNDNKIIRKYSIL